MPQSARTPAEVVAEALRLLLAKDMVGFAGLWAERGSIEFPFAPAGYPAEVTGRAAIEDYLRDYPEQLDIRAIDAPTVHVTEDPEVVIVEFAADGIAVRTGRPYRMRYIAVITVRAGEIVHYRDYWNPLAAAEALGGAGELTSFGATEGKSMSEATILVTGGTGTTGSRIAAGLVAEGAEVRIASRNPQGDNHIRFDWHDPETYGPALNGVDAIYLVPPIGATDPASIVEPFLAQAVQAGVRRVVLLGSSAVSAEAPGLGKLYGAVRGAVPEWAVLRPSWFMQNFVGGHPVAAGIRAAGEIVTATGDGRVAFVDAEDIAAVAVRALLDPVPHNTEHVITGPEALSYAQAAVIIAEETGRVVRHESVGVAEFADLVRESGVPADYAAFLAGLDDDIRRGAEDRVTSVVPDVTGRDAGSFRAFIARNWTELAVDMAAEVVVLPGGSVH
ncbi:nuclear transport factor 2 family protein [Nocardia colli]|nr:nuclear transport factor 2 family protein [Nocardia colli]